jgi:hypothetical protein
VQEKTLKVVLVILVTLSSVIKQDSVFDLCRLASAPKVLLARLHMDMKIYVCQAMKWAWACLIPIK